MATSAEQTVLQASCSTAAALVALRRQRSAALRSLLRPGSYIGATREILLTSVHVLAYPLGLLPHRRAQHALDRGTATRPVMLVHGWVHNRSAFLMMARALRGAGLGPIHTFTYSSITADLRVAAERLGRAVDRLCDETGATRCVLIGHSMGGLIARRYVQQLGGDRSVETVITMGTPHRGTLTAYLGLGRAVAQCRPGSDFLRELEQTARPGPTRWIAYYSDLDLMVTPAANAKLLHPALDATNVRVRDTGHLSLLLSRAVLSDIVTRLSPDPAAA